jgi:hypothetical protein
MMLTRRQSVRMLDKLSETVVSTVSHFRVTVVREQSDQSGALACALPGE